MSARTLAADILPARIEPAAPPREEPPLRPGPCTIVIFGGTGDLAERALLPALFDLHLRRLLPERYALLGSARRRASDEEYRARVRGWLAGHPGFTEDAWRPFGERLHYAGADATGPVDEGGWRALQGRLAELRRDASLPGDTLFHLAVPPSAFAPIAERLAAVGETAPAGGGNGAAPGWRRLVVEKPFGRDQRSAIELDALLERHFDADSIYRVDHFLGKETVQNLLVTRFANPEYEPVWNRNYVDHVQITVAESIGIESRGRFYEQTGVVRDMVQNHVLHLLCLVAAEPPVRCFGASLRAETTKVLTAVRPIDPLRDLVLGQYEAGAVDGEEVRGYRDEDEVDPRSGTPTYAALRLELDTWRWAGVPFYLRTGKRMRRKVSEVAIHFRPTPQTMFPGQDDFRSVLTFRLQPEEAVVQTLAAKRPGPRLGVEPVRMSFSYSDAFGLESPPSAYAWLIHDALLGDETLFVTPDWVRRAWAVVDPLSEALERGRAPLLPYRAGGWGPPAADELLAREGRTWSVT